VLLAVGEHVLKDEGRHCVRMATGLAGGVGSTKQEMCGALSGGVLVIGRLFGREQVEEDDQKALALAACYRERFLTEMGATQCARLYELVHTPGGLGSCAAVVERAVQILLDLLEEAG